MPLLRFHRLPQTSKPFISSFSTMSSSPPLPAALSVSSYQGTSNQPKRTSITGLNIRDRAIKALDVGVSSLSISGTDGEPISSSSSSRDSIRSTSTSSSASRIGKQLRQKSASFVSLASLPLNTNSNSDDNNTTNSRSYRKRSLLTDVKNRARKGSVTSALSHEEQESQHRKHNLVPLPPPGYVRPVLLPTYACKTGEEDINIRIDGFVEIWPKSVGTSQRVFNQMVRQMANLPRLPRQQPAPAGTAPTTHQTPWLNQTSASMPTSPLHEDTDDSVFFPDVPYGVPRTASTNKMRAHDGVEEEGFAERITQRAFEMGAPDKAIGKVLQSVGALPVEGKLDEEWEAKMEQEAEQEKREEERLQNEDSSQPNRQGPLGGSPSWSNRTKEDVERLWSTLEHRLRSFWTYRKPYQHVSVEIVPVFQGEQSQEDQEWSLDGYEQSQNSSEEPYFSPLLAMTKLTTDAHGLFSDEITLSKSKLTHYLSHYFPASKRNLSDLLYLRVRACMTNESEETIRSQWQSMRITGDDSTSVRVICDVDDTARHTEVLGGSRVVTRNVFARPFEEVHIAGVTHWFDRLCFEGKVDGFHFVTNAPAEMYQIVKAYLSSAQLPSGHLALKHYFSPTKTASWLQAYLQPAASRKRQNLQRCLDDFPNSKFILIGDSGEMDMEVYTELAKERPNQVKGIWIRDVGNVTSAAKSMANTSFASSIPSTIQPPPAAHLQEPSSNTISSSSSTKGNVSTGAKAMAKRSTEVIRKGSLNVSGTPAATSMNEFELRLNKALAILPSSTRLRFWSSGQDAMDESLEYVKQLKSGTPSYQQL